MVVTASVIGASAMAAPLAVALKISEFRVRGPNGANDEFVELYNEANSPLTVTSAAPSVGWSVVASNGVARFTVPNGTVIPAHGHYLGVNAVGYSLASYPAGTGTTATGDATYTTDIPDNAGIAVFDTSVAADFTLAHRLDAVGSSSEANTLYKEGTGYQALTPFSINYAFPRDLRGGTPKDTASNSADLLFVDTNGTSAGAGQRLGAPGPENLSSPVNLDSGGIGTSLVDPAAGSNAPPNQVRDFTSDPANNSTFGTLDIRRKFTNNTGQAVRRLRIRITDLTTFPSPSTIADLRPRTSTAVVVSLTGGGTTTVQGTTLEQPPAQPNGGGFNSTLSAGTVTLATPLADGASINLRFLMGIQQTGTFRLCGLVEGLPSAGNAISQTGSTENTTPGAACTTVENMVPANIDAPAISAPSPPHPGDSVTVSSNGNWSGSPTEFTYQWLRCPASGACTTDIAGATGSSYPVTADDVNSKLAVRVTAKNLNGPGTAVQSNTTDVVQAAPPAPPPPPPPPAPTPPPPRQQPGCPLKGKQIVGTNAADRRTGTANTDIIFGRGGNDVLRGVGGRDCLYGGDGADRLAGGRGADRLFGGSGADSLDGEDGKRSVAETDRKAGGDRLNGNAGNDVLVDRRGVATLSGGTGNDRLNSRDVSRADRRRRDTVTCGTGKDVALVDRADKVAKSCERVLRR